MTTRLTERQRDALAWIDASGGWCSARLARQSGHATQTLTALARRGYVTGGNAHGNVWRITADGRAALKSQADTVDTTTEGR